jgi:hypothetical protein
LRLLRKSAYKGRFVICSKPDCPQAGIDQPPENFIPKCRICAVCRKRIKDAWREKNKERIREARRWIPDDDPEDDLKPITGDGQWSRITR